MAYDDSLVAVAIVEKDKTEHVLLSWIYPALDPSWEAIIEKHSGLKEKAVQPRFIFLKHGQTWGYFVTVLNQNESQLEAVKAFTIVLLTKTFHPEKYGFLAQLFAAVYTVEGVPPAVLKAYLEVFSKGTFDGTPLGIQNFNSGEYDPRRALLVTSILDIIRMFGKDVILLWTALMMKKKVIVFSENPKNLLRVIRGLPIFVWHRQDWNILRPIVDLQHDVEVADLRNAGVYCAGIVDPVMKNKTEFYDVLVDVDSRSITLADHAKGDFMLTSFQRDLAEFLVTSSEDAEMNDQLLIKQMVGKVKGLLQRIDSLRGEDDYLTPEKLTEAKLPAQMANFVFSIAAAEGLTKVTG